MTHATPPRAPHPEPPTERTDSCWTQSSPPLDPIVTALVPLAERGYWGPGPWMLDFPLVWIVVIVAAVWFFRSRGWGRPSTGPSATEVLDRLFAEGTISAEEYRARRQVLAGRE